MKLKSILLEVRIFKHDMLHVNLTLSKLLTNISDFAWRWVNED